jgi:hypothetical protein
MEDLRPVDLRAAAHVATEFLGGQLERDWSTRAGPLKWDCRETLEHIIDVLDVYAVLLATRAERFAPAVRIARDSNVPLKGLLRTIRAKAAILCEVAAAAPGDTRGFHPRGFADPSGFAAMGCNEVLIHTSDIASGFRVNFAPPDDVAQKVLNRLFPWAPQEAPPWEALLWANDRQDLPQAGRIGEEWTIWCRPLDEWDGSFKTRRDTALSNPEL